jgi:hypothetical protein
VIAEKQFMIAEEQFMIAEKQFMIAEEQCVIAEEQSGAQPEQVPDVENGASDDFGAVSPEASGVKAGQFNCAPISATRGASRKQAESA